MMGKKLSVRMFGGFSATYGDEVLTFGRQRDSKFGQLFQILMTRPGQGFSKNYIAESLYEREEVEDSNASLNNTIFRLRKYLESSPLPSGEYLHLNGGVLCFDGGVDIESDVWRFESANREYQQEQNARQKAELCGKACKLFRGEFLPQLSNEQWVIEKSQSYHKAYAGMLEYLLHYLKEEGDYRSAEQAAACASAIYPYEGWEAWQIECLILLGRHKEAEELYQKLALYIQETSGFLSQKQQARFREIGARIRYSEGAEGDISRCLMEPVFKQGAYACTLPGFSDCFRMLKRVNVRGGVKSFGLFLCTILDDDGCPASDRRYCERQGKKLCASFESYLRRGDIYTKYSESQYLLLCIGAKNENAARIGERIDMDFRKRCGGHGGVSWRMLDDGDEFSNTL
ncbi:MAG: hypothetical protein HFJ05_01195 [Eubacterium sp.]|nr:hypothetical protein [Eubacterium sp.]